MIPNRIATKLAVRLSKLSLQRPMYDIRSFTTNGGGKDDSEEDAFGINFEDGVDKTGPHESLPPLYQRDPATGRLTGEVVAELSPEDRKILQADPISNAERLSDRIDDHWKNIADEKDGIPTALSQLGRRVREQDLAMSTLGRSVEAQEAEEQLQGGNTIGRTDDRMSQALTPDEFKGFQEYMRKVHDTEIDESDMPVMENTKEHIVNSADDTELSLKWMTARAQRQMDDSIEDNPYSDLMPGDLSPTRLVNRKRAKQIPRRLLHHNNLPLLRTFLSPVGTIQHRVQTRLGTRDQRKISKLVKRARALGLIPFSGQFKVEEHGWVHSKDMKSSRPWEKELRRRGLVIRSNKKKKVESLDVPNPTEGVSQTSSQTA